MSWYLLAIMAAVFLGIYSIIEKRGLKRSNSLSFLLTSSFFITILSIPIVFTRNVFIFSPTEMALLVIKSLFAALFFLFIARALEKMEISEFAPFLSFSPVIVLIFSYIFLRESVGLLALSGILLVVIGAYILELNDGLLSPLRAIKDNESIHFIFFGLFFGALCAVIDRSILLREPDLLSFFFLNNVLIFLFFALFSFFRKNNLKTLSKHLKPVTPWALLGALFYMTGDLLYFKALTMPTALIALVIALKRLSILISTIIGGEIFHEDNLLRKTIATLIMLGGVFLIIL